jgi:hypothetical protein
LIREADELMKTAMAQFEESGEKQRLFCALEYRAETWHSSCTVIANAEPSRNGTHLRFVVTNLWVGSSRHAEQRYDDYVQRGTSEQRNDELKNGLSMHRLSCHRFMANFWRLLLYVHAYNLLNTLPDSDDIPLELRHAQPGRWRSRMIKVAARVVQSISTYRPSAVCQLAPLANVRSRLRTSTRITPCPLMTPPSRCQGPANQKHLMG